MLGLTGNERDTNLFRVLTIDGFHESLDKPLLIQPLEQKITLISIHFKIW